MRSTPSLNGVTDPPTHSEPDGSWWTRIELGRPQGCRPDAYSGSTRLNPKPLNRGHKHNHKKKHKKIATKASAGR